MEKQQAINNLKNSPSLFSQQCSFGGRCEPDHRGRKMGLQRASSNETESLIEVSLVPILVLHMTDRLSWTEQVLAKQRC